MARPTALQCPSCSSPIDKDQVDAHNGYLKCEYCGTLMNLPKVPGRPQAFRTRPEIDLPKGIELETRPHGVVLARRWFSATVFFLIPFCLVWNGILIAAYRQMGESGAPLGFRLFPLIHVLVGGYLTYFCLAKLFNSTRIAVERGEIRISHGPLPWPGYRRIAGVLVDQLYAKSHVSHSRNGPQVQYQVWALLNNGKREKLIPNAMNADQALYIEQQIETALGIEDRAVAGELPR